MEIRVAERNARVPKMLDHTLLLYGDVRASAAYLCKAYLQLDSLSVYLACHISSLATRSQDAEWKLHTERGRERGEEFKKLQAVTLNEYKCEYIVPLDSGALNKYLMRKL